jgi:GntR family transcriptional regulator, transcriptional repressor for pyruvate dehydrogenase complex
LQQNLYDKFTVTHSPLTDTRPAAVSVADQLTSYVLGKLQPGMRLPSEADLAERYGVSRVTMREAVKMLAGRGLLDVARGRRAIVRQPDGSVFGDFLTSLIKSDSKHLFDLIQVRRSLEIQSATMAARHASRAGIMAAEAALARMRAAAQDARRGGEDAAAQMRFHQADALTSGNRVLSYLFEGMALPFRESFHVSLRGQQMRGLSLEDSVAAHAHILACISNGDVKGAGEAMSKLLDDAERNIRMAYSPASLS